MCVLNYILRLLNLLNYINFTLNYINYIFMKFIFNYNKLNDILKLH